MSAFERTLQSHLVSYRIVRNNHASTGSIRLPITNRTPCSFSLETGIREKVRVARAAHLHSVNLLLSATNSWSLGRDGAGLLSSRRARGLPTGD